MYKICCSNNTTDFNVTNETSNSTLFDDKLFHLKPGLDKESRYFRKIKRSHIFVVKCHCKLMGN